MRAYITISDSTEVFENKFKENSSYQNQHFQESRKWM
uniref:Uncharacterized protein n=1 Tax=Rhizophora mucronata TaxID=61149 RepID=A0A2P2NM84_RHIMU